MNKVLSFILCLVPAVLFWGSVIPLMGISVAEEMGTISYEALGVGMILILIGALLSVIAVYGVMIWLMIKTVKNPNIDKGLKVVWCICLYMFNMFVFPVYWFIYIRKE